MFVVVSAARVMPFPKITNLEQALRLSKGLERQSETTDYMRSLPQVILKMAFEMAQVLQGITRYYSDADFAERKECNRIRRTFSKAIRKVDDIMDMLPRDNYQVRPMIGHMERLKQFINVMKY